MFWVGLPCFSTMVVLQATMEYWLSITPAGYDVAQHITTTTYLFAAEFDLEVLCGLLCDPSAEVELVHLAVLVPQRRLVVQHKVTGPEDGAWGRSLHTSTMDPYCPQLQQGMADFILWV
jgi:hypothetical protein